MDAQSGQPHCTAGMAMTMPAKPIIEPIDRSNSPAIISSATAAAMMPSCADTSRKLTMPFALNSPLEPAVNAKQHEHQHGACHRAQFRPLQQPAEKAELADPLVR